MAHVIQLDLGAFMNSEGAKGGTKYWEAHERDQQFGENESIEIGRVKDFEKRAMLESTKSLPWAQV